MLEENIKLFVVTLVPQKGQNASARSFLENSVNLTIRTSEVIHKPSFWLVGPRPHLHFLIPIVHLPIPLFLSSSLAGVPPLRNLAHPLTHNVTISLVNAIRSKYVLSSCANSLSALMAFAFSRVRRPVIPKSLRISFSRLICPDGVSKSANSFFHILRTPQATTIA